jgi:hypothetical protein
MPNACSQKRRGHLLKTTFVSRLFKILSADGRASATKIKINAKKSIFSSLFSKVAVQILFVACSKRLSKSQQENNNI